MFAQTLVPPVLYFRLPPPICNVFSPVFEVNIKFVPFPSIRTHMNLSDLDVEVSRSRTEMQDPQEEKQDPDYIPVGGGDRLDSAFLFCVLRKSRQNTSFI
jgi:hypothetical protein